MPPPPDGRRWPPRRRVTRRVPRGRTDGPRAARARCSARARATRAATPTSASGPATTRPLAFLENYLTSERLKRLCPDCAPFPLERHELANLRALNFVIHGLLGEGVAASTRIDPQAKTLAEYVRAVSIEVPATLLS